MPVAAIVGETKGALVDNLEEALRPAAMLDIGRAIGGGGGKKYRVLLGNEGGKLRRQLVGKSFHQPVLIGLGGAAVGLRLLGCRREDPGGIIHGRGKLLSTRDRAQDRRLLPLRKEPNAIKLTWRLSPGSFLVCVGDLFAAVGGIVAMTGETANDAAAAGESAPAIFVVIELAGGALGWSDLLRHCGRLARLNRTLRQGSLCASWQLAELCSQYRPAKAANGPIVRSPVPTQMALVTVTSAGQGSLHCGTLNAMKQAASVIPQALPAQTSRVKALRSKRLAIVNAISGSPMLDRASR